jgi:hypothetical protein
VRLTAEQLREIESKPGYRVSGSVGGGRKGSKLEPDTRDAALVEAQAKAGDTGVFYVRVVSFRRRLLDEDNLCEKFFVDCCRYAGLLPSDAAGKARIAVSQEKVGSEAEERTEIIIDRAP